VTHPYRLLAPGPVPMPPEVLAVMGTPIWHHRTPAFEKVLGDCYAGLKEVFQTTQPVLVLTSTGSGAMEAAITNTLSPGDSVFCVVGGKFGERWADMCKRYDVSTHIFEVEWGKAIDLSAYEAALKQAGPVKAVLSQVCETSTATLFPVSKMAAIAKKLYPETLFMADAITAIGVTELAMDKDNIDIVVAGSQKAFMIPTGLSFIAMSNAAWKAQKESKIKKYYFDLALEKKALETKQTYFSSSVQMIRALAAALPRMTGNNQAQLLNRTARLMKATHAGAKQIGLKIYSESPSPSVTAILLDSSVNSEKVRDELETQFNVTIMGGQDRLKGKILRIGHLGYIKNDDLLFLLEKMSVVLNKHGAKISEQQIAAALKACEAELGTDVK
jgi:aspartate aminotransferase-like enzyme